jgi:hypothetical protein
MAWFKVDDGFYVSTKFLEIPREHQVQSAGLWMLAGVFSADNMTDGFVSYKQMRLWEFDPQIIQQLIEVGLWDEVEDGIQFHDWCDYQPSREQLESRREAKSAAKSAAGAKGGVASGEARRSKSQANAKQNEAKRSPEPEPEPEPNNLRELPAAPISPDFSPDYDHAEWAKTEWPTVNWEAETAKFVNHFLSKGEKRRDWVAAWRNWIIIEGERSLKRAEVQRSKYPDGKF